VAKTKTAFFCRECGNETPRWQGQCPACREWNTLVEEPSAPKRSASAGAPVNRAATDAVPVRLRDVEGAERRRWTTGLGEFDFVLGGGIVPGSVVLVGGEPGIGKSTILLQVAARLEGAGLSTLYVSGEESAHQVKLRAERLGEHAADVTLLAETELDGILLRAVEGGPQVLLIDSIQTVYSPSLEGAPGNVGQVRECAARLQRFAKQTGTAVFLVGHVTKGGGIAGPKTLEHIVDTVLYFEGEGGVDHRVLRATKNARDQEPLRRGGRDRRVPYDGAGTRGRSQPVGAVHGRPPGRRVRLRRGRGDGGDAAAAGGGAGAGGEGELRRPAAGEHGAGPQAPGAAARGAGEARGDPLRPARRLSQRGRRAAAGGNVGRPGRGRGAGLERVRPPGSRGRRVHPVPADAVFIGELGLGGEVRPVGQMERRLAEAARMGFTAAYLSPRAVPRTPPAGIRVIPTEDVRALVRHAFS